MGDYFTVLKRGENLVEQRMMPIKVKYMNADEKKKWEVIQESRKIFEEEQRKKKKLMEEI